jgi:hypothetical protein
MGYVESELLRICKPMPVLVYEGPPRVLKSVLYLAPSQPTSQRSASTVSSESRCALRLRYVDLVVSIEARLMS